MKLGLMVGYWQGGAPWDFVSRAQERLAAKKYADALNEFEAAQPRITAQACRANAERFSVQRFEQEMKAFVDRELAAAHLARMPSQYWVPHAAPNLIDNELPSRVVPIKSV